ncbi:MAG: prepilin-type N-terminal cleavage/methylation domain-containing protein [Parcubacteria group bacterium]|nr:prepilin-type N-terminal cleavage/methylation domain-containing protein [Parcubacteria group bacterium]MCR4342657.1 prepilin-type N-terminal cleavage/methylation domain-containing protein [Patescibacteria group bacterium]
MLGINKIEKNEDKNLRIGFPLGDNGFTLLELLVVIAIIGLFATIATVALSNARMRARDIRRETDMNEIQKALELYFDDNGDYPLGGHDTCSGAWGSGFDGPAKLGPYIKAPIDPLNTNGPSCVAGDRYYAFYNPITWDMGAKCPAGTIVLYAYIGPELASSEYRSDCGTNFFTRILNK